MGMPQNIKRHAILNGLRNDLVSDSNSSFVDPFPPPNKRSDYETIDFEDVFRNPSGQGETTQSNLFSEFVLSLVPNEYQVTFLKIKTFYCNGFSSKEVKARKTFAFSYINFNSVFIIVRLFFAFFEVEENC